MGGVPAVAALTLLGGILLLGCAGGDCEAKAGRAREECRYEQVKALEGDALAAALDRIPEEASRDLLVIRLAVDHPERAVALCTLARTAVGRGKCDRVVGRPHLGGAR